MVVLDEIFNLVMKNVVHKILNIYKVVDFNISRCEQEFVFE